MDEQGLIQKLKACSGNFTGELRKLRVGRASVELVENIPIQAYENTMPLKQVASISIPEASSLLIIPWDKTLVPSIEKAIRDADLGLQPIVSGEQVRVNIPPLTEERRIGLVKILNQETENARVCVRKLREDTMKEVDKAESSGEISEDDKFRLRDMIQKNIEKYNQEIEGIRANKEREITTL